MKRLILLRCCKRAVFTLLALTCTSVVFAETILVSSVAELQSAIDKVKPGTEIRVKDGQYITETDILIRARGTAKQPVLITAEHAGAVEILGKGGFSLLDPATYVTISGFKFTHQASKAKSGAGTSFCRWTHNIFENAGNGEDLTLAGNDQEVDYNTFQNKASMGRFIAVRGHDSQIAQRLHIHHNYFNNFSQQTGNGAEALQFGLSGFSMSTSNSIVEHNVFERCAGENELISVKASGLVLRYNTIRDCPAQFTLRHGNKNSVYGNYFTRTPGLRIFGDDQTVYGNYFEDCKPAITIGNGDGEVADGSKLTVHDRPDRILIAFNTLIGNPENIILPNRKDGMGATLVTVAYNVIQGGGQAVMIAGPLTGATWEGNMIFKTRSAGDMPSSGYVDKDPELVKTVNGTYDFKRGKSLADQFAARFPAVSSMAPVPVLTVKEVGAAAGQR